MRGKKINVDFVSEYISNCAKINKNSIQDICLEAQLELYDIDSQIKKIEELKKKRSLVQDVLIYFNKNNIDLSKDKEVLSFYNIPNLKLAYTICKLLKDKKEIQVNMIDSLNKENVKQMLNIDVLQRIDNKILPGSKFEYFVEFYNRTYKE